jgi:hypothetical protein
MPETSVIRSTTGKNTYMIAFSKLLETRPAFELIIWLRTELLFETSAKRLFW